jgi:CubicO group peptidase (beta-lactamase class C family)
VIALLCGQLLLPVATHADTDRHAQIDRLFAPNHRKDSPGCAIAIVQDGEIVYHKGYGRANLEYDAPITPETVFHVASVSKQFTAFAIQLLASEGKLALDDDVRKYLPELHDFGKTITIRHLLHHTSGLRDQWSLLTLAGWRMEDVITEPDILGLIWRQRALNFDPGAEHLYCNTGYTLLGLIVKRVSGKSLREFCQERIFGPLGMSHTHFHDDNTEIVRGRAYSYYPAGKGFQLDPLQYANVGATSLFTTVDDLAKWDENFYTARVGGSAVIAAMQEKGTLNSGKEIGYASGLEIGEYRGLRTVEHGGSDAAFRSNILRFPDQHFSVIVLCNLGSMNPGGLSRKIADMYLADRLQPEKPAPPAPQAVKADPSKLNACVGDYQLSPDLILTFKHTGDRLMLEATARGTMETVPVAENEFMIKGMDVHLRFVPGPSGKAESVYLKEGNSDTPAPRIERIHPTPEQLSEIAGDYYSDELGVIYTLSVRNGALVARYPRGEITLEAVRPDYFIGRYPMGAVYFTHGPGALSGFRVDDGRVRGLTFVRVQLPGGSS